MRPTALLFLVGACAAPAGQVQAPEESVAIAAPTDAGAPELEAVKQPAPAPPGPEDREAARRFFQQGVRFYSEGDYARALAEFQKAYAAAPLAQVLYNIGMCQEQTGDGEAAVHTYERALADLPATAPSRPQIEQRLRQLRQKLGLPP